MASGSVKKQAGFPNFSQSTDITGGSNRGDFSWTAPSDGIVYLFFGFRSDKWIYVLVNSNVATLTAGSNASLSFQTVPVMLKAGDVLSFSELDGWNAFLASPTYFFAYG